MGSDMSEKEVVPGDEPIGHEFDFPPLSAMPGNHSHPARSFPPEIGAIGPRVPPASLHCSWQVFVFWWVVKELNWLSHRNSQPASARQPGGVGAQGHGSRGLPFCQGRRRRNHESGPEREDERRLTHLVQAQICAVPGFVGSPILFIFLATQELQGLV